MQRDPIEKDGDYGSCTFTMESAKEMQEWGRFLPPSCDLPTTHEYFVEDFTEQVNGMDLTRKRVGVRLKAEQPAAEADGLNKLSDADLEVQAAQRGMDRGEFLKLETKARKIKALREFDKKKEPKKQTAVV